MVDFRQSDAASARHLVTQLAADLDWHNLPETADAVLQQALTVQQIPAPTFAEANRANYVADQFRALGLVDVSVDVLHNVYGRLPGTAGSEAAMIMAHTDTVFPLETDLATRQENDRYYGPGLGDNSLGVAGLLGLIQWLQAQQVVPAKDLWFVATVREEGLGDLGGVRAAYQRLQSQIRLVINLEGMAFGHVYHAGIAVRRMHITASTQGGHSWAHFGRPSAIHVILGLGARLAALDVSQKPRSTYNIGMIEGGRSINTIASDAGLWLDLRSETGEGLLDLEQQVSAQIRAAEHADVTLSAEIVGDRPAGGIAPTHPLVQIATLALERVDVKATLATGSTDGNIPLAAGCPTVTLGISRGGNAHRLDEYIEIGPIQDGMKALILTVVAAAMAD